MRQIIALMAVLLAATAFAQTSIVMPPQRTPANQTPNLLPAQTPTTDKPAFIEETTQIDTKTRGYVQRKSANPYAELPTDVAEKLTQADQARQAAQQKFYRKVAEPILSPDGKELVGIVENRYLTKEELKKRAAIMMKALPRSEQTGLIVAASDMNKDTKLAEEDRQVLVEGQVLDDWVRVATLAVHAEHASQEVPTLRVSDAEIDAAISRISDETKIDVSKIPVAMQSVMLSKSELRAEVRDSLLIEKYMNEYIKRTISEKTMKELFEKDPSVFIEPTKVHAFEMFIPKVGIQQGDDTRKTEKIIHGWRSSFSRCDNLDDLNKLGEKIKKEQTTMILSDMGWVLSTDGGLDPEIHRAIFELKQGKTSKVISSAQGYQVFKAIERTEGDKPDFEKARPNVVAYLTNKLRDPVYENVKGQYGVRMAAGGLKKWTIVGTVTESGAPATSATTTAVAPAAATAAIARPPITVNTEPNLGLLRRPASTGRRSYRGATLPSVESVVGAKAQQHGSGVHRSGASSGARTAATPTPTR